MKKCIECGSTRNVYSKQFGVDLCPNCTRMYREHPQHELPDVGEVKYDSDGRPICHICGRAFNKLLAHVRQRHGITAAEYKSEFELDSGKGIISDRTRAELRKRVEDNYNVVVVENLVKKGSDTRFKNGDPGRTKDKVRLQTKNQLLKHIRDISLNKSV